MTFYNIKKFIWSIIIVFSILMSVALVEEKFFLKDSADEIISIGSQWRASIDSAKLEKMVSLPININNINDNEKIVISKRIKAKNIKNPVMLIRAELQTVSVYLDNELLYEHKKSKEQLFGKEPESNWLFVELPKDYDGKIIKIEYSSKYNKSRGQIHDIFLGSKVDLFAKIIKENGNKFIGSIILFAIGILLAAIYYGLMHANEKYKKIFYLSLINICTSIWISLDSNIIELFIRDVFPRGEIKIINLILVLALIIEFLKAIFKDKYTRILNYSQYSIIVYLIIASFLHFNNIVHYIDTLFIFHLLCLIMFITFICICVKEDIHIIDKYRYIIIPVIISAVAAAIDIINYYNIRNRYVTHFSEYAIIVFSLVFSYYVGKDFLNMYNHEVKTELYKELAYTDPLTKLYNKAAFDEKMTLMNSEIAKYYGMPIFVFNINNTRKLNNTVGHNKGNEFIKENAKILVEIFKEYGDLFRVGGDEFVFIGKNNTPIGQCEEKLARYVEISIPEYKIFFTGISYGYDIITPKNNSVYEVHASADQNMCKLKNRLRFSNIR